MTPNRFLAFTRRLFFSAMLLVSWAAPSFASPPSRDDALASMKRATRFMAEKVAVHGGYVWFYLPDLSRRWGELEARSQMI